MNDLLRGARDAFEFLAKLDSHINEREDQNVRFRDELKQCRISGTSPDGAISLTVDSRGVLTDLQLTPAAMRMSAKQLQGHILTGVAAACAQLPSKVADLASDVYGANATETAMLTGQYRDLFPDSITPTDNRTHDERERQ